MKTHLLKCMPIALLSLLTACERDAAPLKSPQKLTRDEALQTVKNEFLKPDSLNKAIYGFRDLLPKSEAVFVSGSTNKFYHVEYESWLFLLEYGYLISKWPHLCKYIFVNATDGSYEAFSDSQLPVRFSEMDTVFVWARPQTKALPPLTFQDESRGCGHIRVHKVNQEYTAAIVVQTDTAKLHLSTETKTFEIGSRVEGLQVYIDFYYYVPEGNGAIGVHYCNDLAFNHTPPRKWYAQQGKVQITLADLGLSEIGYKATVRLEDVHFVDENGQNEIVLSQLIFKDVFVGWLPG